ncbi:MAG: hypothetical protein E6G27_13920 [Actinobacteria bacterium]|nr:MAG: hypothetical protein E6G27_13920 [Actinomycetota bacterium]
MFVDCDMHLFEPRDMWASHLDATRRDLALRLEDDDQGYTWLAWRDRRVALADVNIPGNVDAIGAHRRRLREGLPSDVDYNELARPYSAPADRLRLLDALGLEGAVLFPNYGLLWERPLEADLPATLANLAAWNRWAAEVAAEGPGRLHPVAHLTLRDLGWVEAQLAELSGAGIRLAMIAPALVDGLPLSAPELDRAWAAFVDHGITPVFHVANQRRVFDDAWYGADDDAVISLFSSIFIWTPVALALADLALNGVLERHPDLRLGVMELSAVWVPLFLMMLDGGYDFTNRFNGAPLRPLAGRPSDYLRRQVRVAAFSYERPDRLTARSGDLFMACSDYPHGEGTATPVEDYARVGLTPDSAPGLFGGNVSFLLRRTYS